MYRTLIGSLLVLLIATSSAPGAPVPAEDAKAVVRAFFKNVESGAGDSAPLLAAPAKDVIPELARYLMTGSDSEQSHAVRLIAFVGRRSSEKDVRALAVKALLAYATTERGSARGQAFDGLLRFSAADFPKTAGAEIEKLVRANDPYSEALLLAGIVGVKSAADDLKALTKVASGSRFGNPAWSARLALARLGDADSARFCAETIVAERDVVQRVRHFPELAFIRHKVGAAALTKYLMSDELLPDPKPNLPGTRVALYALDVLAERVEGFPIKHECGPTYTTEQLIAARKWAGEQKELKFKP